jgi:hypothetical protein
MQAETIIGRGTEGREVQIKICSVKLCVHSVKLCVELTSLSGRGG